MTTNDLLEALARLRVETGSLACLGCGREVMGPRSGFERSIKAVERPERDAKP